LSERTQHLQQNGRPDVSVILPTFNERDNIVALVEELRSRFRAGRYSYELLVVDDQSPDGTGQIVAAAFAEDPGVRVTSPRMPCCCSKSRNTSIWSLAHASPSVAACQTCRATT